MKNKPNMKKRLPLYLAVAVVFIGIVCWMGIGYYSSGAAVRDLKADLVNLHGEPYTGREVEGGTETMEFSIKSDTFFLTNYNLRHFFGWDYRYKCEVIYTVSDDNGIVRVRKINYVGIDPMGADESDIRAYIEMSNVKGQSSIS